MGFNVLNISKKTEIRVFVFLEKSSKIRILTKVKLKNILVF